MISCFLGNISAKYYKNPSMLSRVIAKNVGDVFFETQCIARECVRLRDLDELKQRLRMEWAKLDRVVIVVAFVSFVVDSSISVMRVLYTFSCNISTCCYQLDSNLSNLETTVAVG